MRATNDRTDRHPRESADRFAHAIKCARFGSRADHVPYVVTADGSAFAASLQSDPETTLYVVHPRGAVIPVSKG